jgi:hypothetical protein
MGMTGLDRPARVEGGDGKLGRTQEIVPFARGVRIWHTGAHIKMGCISRWHLRGTLTGDHEQP